MVVLLCTNRTLVEESRELVYETLQNLDIVIPKHRTPLKLLLMLAKISDTVCEKCKKRFNISRYINYCSLCFDAKPFERVVKSHIFSWFKITHLERACLPQKKTRRTFRLLNVVDLIQRLENRNGKLPPYNDLTRQERLDNYIRERVSTADEESVARIETAMYADKAKKKNQMVTNLIKSECKKKCIPWNECQIIPKLLICDMFKNNNATIDEFLKYVNIYIDSIADCNNKKVEVKECILQIYNNYKEYQTGELLNILNCCDIEILELENLVLADDNLREYINTPSMRLSMYSNYIQSTVVYNIRYLRLMKIFFQNPFWTTRRMTEHKQEIILTGPASKYLYKNSIMETEEEFMLIVALENQIRKYVQLSSFPTSSSDETYVKDVQNVLNLYEIKGHFEYYMLYFAKMSYNMLQSAYQTARYVYFSTYTPYVSNLIHSVEMYGGARGEYYARKNISEPRYYFPWLSEGIVQHVQQ